MLFMSQAEVKGFALAISSTETVIFEPQHQ
jgi:hypothetical protein